MPSLTFTQSIAAGGTYNPVSDWNYEFAPQAGVISYIHNATAVGLLATITSGSDQLLQESPVPAGGVSGVIPSANLVAPIIDAVAAGDKQAVRYRNPTGGAIIVNGIIDYTAA